MYRLNGKTMKKEEVVTIIANYIKSNNLQDELLSLLPHYTVEQNVKHHPCKVAKELGFTIEFM